MTGRDADHVVHDVASLVHASGVGLWLIVWIVENSGGSVTFENTESGAVTTFELPRVS